MNERDYITLKKLFWYVKINKNRLGTGLFHYHRKSTPTSITTTVSKNEKKKGNFKKIR